MHIVDKSRLAEIENLPGLLQYEYRNNYHFEQGFNVGYDKGFISGMVYAAKLSGISEDKLNEALRGDGNERS